MKFLFISCCVPKWTFHGTEWSQCRALCISCHKSKHVGLGQLLHGYIIYFVHKVKGTTINLVREINRQFSFFFQYVYVFFMDKRYYSVTWFCNKLMDFVAQNVFCLWKLLWHSWCPCYSKLYRTKCWSLCWQGQHSHNSFAPHRMPCLRMSYRSICLLRIVAYMLTVSILWITGSDM